MAGTAVIGVVFVDIKGFCYGEYAPKERNLGNIRFYHGGVSRNVAENIAHGGMPVTFVSLTDRSALGSDVVNRLKDAGADTRYVLPCEANGMGMWMVILDDQGGVAGQISCMPDISALEELIRQHGEEIIADCDNIILEMDTSEELSVMVLTLAERFGKKVYPIVGNMSVILRRRDLLARTHCFICNELEAGRLFDGDFTAFSPEEMLERLVSELKNSSLPSMVITMGEKGAVWVDRESQKSGICPSLPTRVVDSTGAGDAFLSGTVMGLTRGLPLGEAVRIGTRMASAVISTDESSCPKMAGLWDMVEC